VIFVLPEHCNIFFPVEYVRQGFYPTRNEDVGKNWVREGCCYHAYVQERDEIRK
jgi:hypothetical protein